MYHVFVCVCSVELYVDDGPVDGDDDWLITGSLQVQCRAYFVLLCVCVCMSVYVCV